VNVEMFTENIPSARADVIYKHLCNLITPSHPPPPSPT